ncbi:unnamed protein product, partial [Laminaria digitata]
GTNSFSPSSSVGGAGGVDGGGGGGASTARGVAARIGTGGGSDAGKNAASGGFFGSDEPRCARCSNTDASGQAQVITCGSCGNGFHTFCVGEKRVPHGLFPPEQRDLREAFVAENFGTRWQCPKCQTQAAQASPPRSNGSYTPPYRDFDSSPSSARGGTRPSTLARDVNGDSLEDISPAKQATPAAATVAAETGGAVETAET